MVWNSKLRISISLLLLLCCSFSLLAQDGVLMITLPRAEIVSIRNELAVLQESLRLKEIIIQQSLTDLDGQQQLLLQQQKQLQDLKSQIEDLQKRIEELLQTSEISQKEWEKILSDWEELYKDLMDTLKTQNRQLENRKYWIGGSFAVGVTLGVVTTVYGQDMVEWVVDLFK